MFYPDKALMAKSIISAVEKKRRLSQREKYEQLKHLALFIEDDSFPLTLESLQTLIVLSVSEESEAVRSEARANLVKLAAFKLPQIKSLFRLLVPNL